jgi:hypothetical protein
LKNGTSLRLRAATVVIGNEQGAWLDVIEPGETREFELNNLDEEAPRIHVGWGAALHHQMKLESLGRFAMDDTAAGETRLIAWTDDSLPGMTITPEAAQLQHATIIVAHLNYGPPQPIEIDVSSRAAYPRDTHLDVEHFNTLPETDEIIPEMPPSEQGAP